MFWKKKPKEVVVRPPAPCGDDKEHYYWEEIGWSCPVCSGIEDRKREQREKEELAEMIAQKVVGKLKNETT